MKGTLYVSAIIFLWAIAGCGRTTVPTGDGGSVSSDRAGNMTVTDKDGNRVDVSTEKDGQWKAKTSKGEEMTASKDGFTMTNEKGETTSIGASDVSESELGLPFYPGSEAIKGRDMKAITDKSDTFVSSRTTKDDPAKVIAFYQSKLTKPETVTTSQFASVSGTLDDGRKVNIMAMNKDSGGTEIQVSVVSEKK